MSPKKKAVTLLLMVPLHFAFWVVQMLVFEHRLLLVLAGVNVLALAFMLGRIRCPGCRWPIAKRRVRVGDLHWDIAVPWYPSRCVSCGFDLTASSPPAQPE